MFDNDLRNIGYGIMFLLGGIALEWAYRQYKKYKNKRKVVVMSEVDEYKGTSLSKKDKEVFLRARLWDLQADRYELEDELKEIKKKEKFYNDELFKLFE